MKTSPPPELWRFSHRHPRAEARGYPDAAANVIEVQVGSEAEPFGCTDNHPFWSVDREQFMEAGQLRIGENLQSADGTLVQVVRITPRRGPPVDVFSVALDEGQRLVRSGYRCRNVFAVRGPQEPRRSQ